MVANIQGIDQEYKPWGGLAGVATGERRALTDFANQQALQQANLENVLKEVEARRAQADYNNPDMELWRQQGIMGKNKEAFSQGELSYQTLDSNVKTKLAENLSKASSAEIESTLNGLQTFVIEASSGQGGLGMQQALSKFPPHIQQVVQKLEAQQPGSSITYAKQLLDVMKNTLADTPKLRGEMIAKDREYENQAIIHQEDRASQEKIAGMNNATQKQLEQMRIDAGKYANRNADKLVLFQKLNPTIQLAKVNAAILAGVDPITGEKLDESGKSYWTMYGQSLGASAELSAQRGEGKIAVPQLANLPAVPTPRVIVPGSPTNPTGNQGRPPLSSFNK